ncbi:MAG TPA: hypothetical protein VGB18_02480 [Candidatus Thermoplasmatota archaeon]
MVRTTVRVVRHGGSIVLIPLPKDAKRARLRPGERRTIELADEPEPTTGRLSGFLSRAGLARDEIRRLGTDEEGEWDA